MTPKSSLGKTSKYSSIVKKVQGDKTPEEPRITPEQVVAAFKSFGYTPNERNHNDIGYWTTKGRSEGVKLIEELSKRRKEDNAKEDEVKKATEDRFKAHDDILNKQHLAKAAMPRLSDTDINALFDEYGLPAPDPEWARSHLPNDPTKIRSILEVQRKLADDTLKKHSKNAVNSIPEVPKTGSASAPSPVPPINNGMGGPTPASPLSIQGAMTPNDSPSTPFFLGDHAVVRMSNPNNTNQKTTWLVDVNKKVLRPFISEQAFHNAFEDPNETEKAVVNITSRDLGKGGSLEGFTPLKGDKGVNHNGSMDPIEFSPAQLQRRYGQASNPSAENKSLSALDGLIGSLNKSTNNQTPNQPQQ